MRVDREILVHSLERVQKANDSLSWESDMFLGMYVELVAKVRGRREIKKENCVLIVYDIQIKFIKLNGKCIHCLRY